MIFRKAERSDIDAIAEIYEEIHTAEEEAMLLSAGSEEYIRQGRLRRLLLRLEICL